MPYKVREIMRLKEEAKGQGKEVKKKKKGKNKTGEQWMNDAFSKLTQLFVRSFLLYK